jgi:hypothetical protein
VTGAGDAGLTDAPPAPHDPRVTRLTVLLDEMRDLVASVADPNTFIALDQRLDEVVAILGIEV